MSKGPIQRIPSVGNSSFYPTLTSLKEIKAGYLYKSPPPKWPNTEKSWKRRFFVLYKLGEQEHQLKYYRSAEEREKDKDLGEIDLSQIMRLYISPQNHPKWTWVMKNFKCSPACVLFIKTAERDYFLIGENSSDVEDWFTALFEALKYRPHRVFDTEDSSDTFMSPAERRSSEGAMAWRSEESGLDSQASGSVFCNEPLTAPNEQAEANKQRSMSDPPPSMRYRSLSEPEAGAECKGRPRSEPVNLYDYPRSYLRNLARKEEVEDARLSISEENNYMKMEAVYEDVRVWRRDSKIDSDVKDGGSLVKSMSKVYDRLKTQLSTERLSIAESDDHREDLDSGCENGPVSPVERSKHIAFLTEKRSSIDSIDETAPQEKDIDVNRADLKKHLTLADIEGKPCVSVWTGQPQCLLQKGDQILAINDLHTACVDDFHTYLSKLLKNDVKLTILRLPGCQLIHSVNCLCSDR